jgi:phage tail-like protein
MRLRCVSPALLLSLVIPLLSHAAPPTIAAVSLHLDGSEAGRFTEIAGAGTVIDVISELYTDSPVVHKRPGKAKHSNLILKRGQLSDHRLLEWFNAALQGQVERKSGSIIYLDREGNEVLRLNLFEAWPTALTSGPIPDEDGNMAVESFTIAVGNIERIAPPKGRKTPDFPQPKGFSVTINGRPVPGVLAVSESGATVEMTDDGSAFVNARSLTLTLDRSAPTELHAWFSEIAQGKEIRKTITVTLRADRTGTVRKFTYFEAWPMRWKAPELNSNSDTYIVEELEFAVERVERG